MATTQETKPSKQSLQKPMTLQQQVVASLESDSDLSRESAKLNRLKQEEQECQSELNALKQSAKNDVTKLAETILAGGNPAEQESVEIKIATLTKRLEAFRQAIQSQKQIVDQAFAKACESVQESVEPEYQARRNRLIAAIEELEAANLHFADLQETLARFKVRNSFSFFGLLQIGQAVKSLQVTVLSKLR